MSGGRPSDYTAELAHAICAELASGKPLVKICRADEFPGLTTVYRWLSENAEFREMYARAREDQADTLADEIIEISDDGSNDTYQTEDGEQVNHDVIARSRLRVDSRKWVAAKLRPRKYGEKLDLEHSGPNGGPIRFERIERVITKPAASNA